MEKTRRILQNDRTGLIDVAKALASSLRISILDLLSQGNMNVKEIASVLNIPNSTASTNLKILEDADLIITSLEPGKHGSMKQCAIKYESLTIDLLKSFVNIGPFYRFAEMPIGGYSAFEAHPSCGLIDDKEFLGKDDDPKTFYSERRFQAQLIWFSHGFVEYKFPKDIVGKIVNLSFSLELCSETPYYRKHCPSDITVWINDVEICTWTCPGDFGGRRGKFTPEWWAINSTQYGFLKTWEVDENESFIDGSRISNVKLRDLKLNELDHIRFKIGIKPDAHNLGGINIFGEKFGDYPQNIIMRIDYLNNNHHFSVTE